MIVEHTKWLAAAAAIDRLCTDFKDGTRPRKDRAIFIRGNANAGKTCFLEWYSARYREQHCLEPAAVDDHLTSYTPVVTIKTPSRPDIPDLAHAIFISIFGEICTLPKRWHEGSYVKTAREQMEEIGCKLLLIDEAQQLTRIKDHEDRELVIDFIKGLIDGVPCPIVFAGLPAVHDLLNDAQIRARTFDEIDLVFNWDCATDRAGMMSAIECLCREIGIEQKDPLEVAVRMWAATQGGFGDMKRLLTAAKNIESAPGRRSTLLAQLGEAFASMPREAIAPGSLGPFAEPIEGPPLARQNNPFCCTLRSLDKIWSGVSHGRAA